MKLVSPLDAAWLYVESPGTPMHVGCLQVFVLPEGAGPDYVGHAVRALRARAHKLTPPYSLKLKRWALGALLPAWIEDPQADLEYHVQHLALPAPGGERELGQMIAELQSRSLDLERPLWECHVIEGLAGNRFALFIKIHHSLMDGIAGVRLLQAALSTDPQRRHMPPPWAVRHVRLPHHAQAHGEHAHGGLKHVLELALGQVRTVPGLYRAFAAFSDAARGKSQRLLSPPYLAPQTPLNGRTSTQRRFATLQLPLERMQAVARRADVKLNDVFLAVCGAALRRYLQEAKALPAQPLVAGIPVSVRPEGDTTVGTAITFMLASLATDEHDPLRRLQRVHQATLAAKQHLQGLRREALTDYTLLLMAPYILELLLGLGGRGHPVFNLAISNVPGPEQPLYFNGARMEAMYPMSVLTHGQSLNITVLSYAGQLNIGYTACSQALPRVQRLARFTREAFEELAARVLQEPAAAPSRRPRRPRGAARCGAGGAIRPTPPAAGPVPPG